MRAIRAVSSAGGTIPGRSHSSVAAGALHAVDLATEIGMRAILIPPSPPASCVRKAWWLQT